MIETLFCIQEQLEAEIGRRQALSAEMQHIQRDNSIALGLGPRRRTSDDGPATLERLKTQLQVR